MSVTEAQLEPLLHFRVVNYLELELFGVDISISNSVVWMWVSAAAVFVLFRLALRSPAVIPGRMQMVAEAAYLFICHMVDENIRGEGRRFLPLIFALFYFVLFCNLLGLIPGAFTPTSQLVVTATLAIGVFGYSVALRVVRQGLGFFRAFAPSGLPPLLLPLMIPLEVLSFMARPVSLAVRLFANMTAGHTVLAVLAFFGLALPWFATWLPLGFSIVLNGAEIFIGFIQAYIFTVLTCVYIDDALHAH